MIETDWLNVMPVLPVFRVDVAHIIEKYHPHADYADACLVAMHEYMDATIWTIDRRDFSLYRTRTGKALATCFPDRLGPGD